MPEAVYSMNQLTNGGAQRQKKRFESKNLHYIRNADIFNQETPLGNFSNFKGSGTYLTENKIRFNNSPEKWKQHSVINSDSSDAIAAGIRTRVSEVSPPPPSIYLN